MMPLRSTSALLLSTIVLAPSSSQAQAETAQLKIEVRDKASDKPTPCRLHLKGPDGKPVRADKLPFHFDHFDCAGSVDLRLPPGKYSVEIERGPEWGAINVSIELKKDAQHDFRAVINRIANMASEGWWSGDLHIHRPPEDIELLMKAEDLNIGPVITWWNNRNLWAKAKQPEEVLHLAEANRFYHLMAGEDEREGGALLYFHLDKPLEITGSTREYPSPLKFVAEARKHKGVWIELEKPFWWDAPTWIAAGEIDSIGIANNHMCRDRMYESEAWGKPRLLERLPNPLGNGYWSQEIYYHVLNCGLRIPPSAGSASGVLPNPVGHNRVYVHLGPELTWEKWWAGLKAGRSFVTNGPLLRVQANGEWPGHVFSAANDKEVSITLKGELTSREKIKAIEIIKDGEVVRKISYDDFQRNGLGSVTFKTSGWFLVRAIADNPKTFRFASTAPWYVEIGDAKRRVSKSSARFFLEWVKERTTRIKLDDAEQRKEVLKHHEAAERFWREKVEKANAE